MGFLKKLFGFTDKQVYSKFTLCLKHDTPIYKAKYTKLYRKGKRFDLTECACCGMKLNLNLAKHEQYPNELFKKRK